MAEETIDTPQESAIEETTTVEGESQTGPTAEAQKTLPPLTAERVTDITFGLGKAAVEVLDKAARQLDDSVRQIRADAPAFLTEMEEKGRPLREKLSEGLRGFNITEVFTRTGEPSPGEPGGDPLEDIEALENRVRELEQQVSGEVLPAEPATTAEPSPFSMLELDELPAVAEETETQDGEEGADPIKKPAARRKKRDEESSSPE